MSQPISKFKDPRGNWRTRSLFADMPPTNGGDHTTTALYWLYDKMDERPCLKDEFIKMNDITGIKFGKKFFGSYEHFKFILESDWFLKQYNLWKEELAMIKQAEAIFNIEVIAKDEEHSQRFQANKYLANKEYEESPSKRGRPSKDEISGNLRREIQKLTEAEEDYKRMTGNLTVINGGKK